MKRESMILLAFASLLVLTPACKKNDGCGIFTCKGGDKVEKKEMKEGMKKKAPKKMNGAAAPKKVAKK